jgi:tetratricopeptide (TPR) repeat protein
LEPERRLQTVLLLINKGRFPEAEALLGDKPRLDPAAFEVALAWGRVLRWQHRFEEAARAYERAIKARPQETEPYLLLAETFLNLGNVPRVLGVLARGKRACPPPTDVKGCLSRFRLLICHLDYDEAADLGERILDLTRRTEDLELITWQIFTEEFDFTPRRPEYVRQALRRLDRFVAARPRQPWGFHFRGLMREFDPHQRQGARADLLRLLEFPSKRYGWMRFKLALCLMQDKDYAAAAKAFRSVAASSRPGLWKAQAFLCECLFKMGRRSEARKAVDAFDAFTPPRDAPGSDFGECWAYRGKLLLWLGHYAEALDALRRASSHTSYDAPCWMGGALVKLGRHEEALAVLDSAAAFQFTPSYAEGRIWRAEALLRLGRPAEALSDLEKPIGRNSPALHQQVVLGLARAALGDEAGLMDSVSRIPEEYLERARKRTGLPGRTDSQRRRLLEEILALSLGVRQGFLPPD